LTRPHAEQFEVAARGVAIADNTIVIGAPNRTIAASKPDFNNNQNPSLDVQLSGQREVLVFQRSKNPIDPANQWQPTARWSVVNEADFFFTEFPPMLLDIQWRPPAIELSSARHLVGVALTFKVSYLCLSMSPGTNIRYLIMPMRMLYRVPAHLALYTYMTVPSVITTVAGKSQKFFTWTAIEALLWVYPSLSMANSSLRARQISTQTIRPMCLP